MGSWGKIGRVWWRLQVERTGRVETWVGKKRHMWWRLQKGSCSLRGDGEYKNVEKCSDGEKDQLTWLPVPRHPAFILSMESQWKAVNRGRMVIFCLLVGSERGREQRGWGRRWGGTVEPRFQMVASWIRVVVVVRRAGDDPTDVGSVDGWW